MADGDWGWDAHGEERRAGLAQLTPVQRMEWLEQTLTLLAASGLLDADRAARQRSADAWRERDDEPRTSA